MYILKNARAWSWTHVVALMAAMARVVDNQRIGWVAGKGSMYVCPDLEGTCNLADIVLGMVDAAKSYLVEGKKFLGLELITKAEDYERAQGNRKSAGIFAGCHRGVAVQMLDALFGIKIVDIPVIEFAKAVIDRIGFEDNKLGAIYKPLSGLEELNQIVTNFKSGAYQRQSDIPHKPGDRRGPQLLFAQQDLVNNWGVPAEEATKIRGHQEAANCCKAGTKEQVADAVNMILSGKVNKPKSAPAKEHDGNLTILKSHGIGAGDVLFDYIAGHLAGDVGSMKRATIRYGEKNMVKPVVEPVVQESTTKSKSRK